MPWNDEADKTQWRGFCIVARELENFPDHQISELVLDVHQLNTGLNCRIFERPNDEYDNLVTTLRRPGFSRIDLALQTDKEELEDWPSFRSGLLKDALSQAHDLQHFSLRTQLDEDACHEAIQPGTAEYIESFIPLRTLSPIEQWQKLEHFGLSNFPIRQDDLLSLLAAMPSTLRSVELSFLIFLGDGGDYRDLLIEMRNTLGWRERSASRRPIVKSHVPGSDESTLETWLDEEVNEYLYGDGENPFADSTTIVGANGVLEGKGVNKNPLDL